MTDWIRIDYNEPSTWPAEGARIEGLRWMGDLDIGWWHASDGVVAYVNLPGFALNDQRMVGFGLHGANWQHFDEHPDDTPEAPTDEWADWWRPSDAVG
jgi:hypothetical protein